MGRKLPQDVSLASLRRHIDRFHPNCPEPLKECFAAEIQGRNWSRKTTCGQAFGIVSTCYVRHQMTDYDALLRKGLTREEARLVIRDELQDIIRSWAPRPQPAGSGEVGPGERADAADELQDAEDQRREVREGEYETVVVTQGVRRGR